jgi:Ion channel
MSEVIAGHQGPRSDGGHLVPWASMEVAGGDASRLRRREREPTDRFGRLLLLLVLSFVFTGLTDDAARYIAGLINGLVLVVAVRSTGMAVSTLRLVVYIGIGFVALAGLVLVNEDSKPGGVAPLLQAAILLLVMRAIGARVVQHRRVTAQTVLGAICLYVLVGLMFSWIYTSMFGFYEQPALVASGGRADPMYYSFVTLTTVGFGDVVSTIEFVRRISLIEAMTGQIFLATLVARLVSMLGMERLGSARPGQES